MSTDSTPKGWERLKLGSTCDVRSSKRVFVNELVDTGVPFYRGTEIGQLGNGQTVEPSLFITREHYERLKTHTGIPQKGDLLLPSICPDGRIHIVENDNPFYFKDGRVLWIKVDRSRIDSVFLRHHLKHLFYSNYSRIASGTTFAELKIFTLKALSIHVPPLSEQKRIAGILDKADAIRRKRQQAIQLTEQFLRSTFLEMFGDPVTNPKGWPVEKMEDLASVDRGKFTPRPRNDPRYYNGDFPFIQTGDLANCDGVLHTWTQTLNEEGIKVSREFPTGTIAIAIAANIGDTAILGFDSYATDSVVGIQVDSLKATAEYIEYWFRFQQVLLKQRAPETAQKNINLQVLRPLPVPTPTISLQEEFSAHYRRFESQRERLNETVTQLDNLFNSLVQRAFRGEL